MFLQGLELRITSNITSYMLQEKPPRTQNLEKIDGLMIDVEVVDAAAKAASVPQMPLGESRLTNLDHYFLGQDF